MLLSFLIGAGSDASSVFFPDWCLNECDTNRCYCCCLQCNPASPFRPACKFPTFYSSWIFDAEQSTISLDIYLVYMCLKITKLMVLLITAILLIVCICCFNHAPLHTKALLNHLRSNFCCISFNVCTSCLMRLWTFVSRHLKKNLCMCLQEGPRTFVGIATFDSTIHFYNLKRALQQVNCCTSLFILL